MKENREKNSFMHNFLTAIGTVMCIVLLPVLLINCTLIVKSILNKKEVPTIFGICPFIVLTDSMYPEIQSGDLIICTGADTKSLKTGDVISFYDPAGNGTSVVTHRIMDVIREKDGNLKFVTKGDANNTEDKEKVPEENVIARYSARIPGLGNAAMFMSTTTGLVVCVVVPVILFIVYDTLRRKAYEKTKNTEKDELMRELEELRAAKAAMEKQ